METGREMSKFIYVFSAADKNELLASGFTLLKSDKKNNIYVFLSNPRLFFSDDIKVFRSSILTF